LLPLSADGENVTDLFGVCVFLPKSRPRGEALWERPVGHMPGSLLRPRPPALPG
jgi:hypothetical protein